jgi:hypothetical protein
VADEIAEEVFLAGLPRGKNGELTPGHTTWDQLGEEAKGRYRRMTEAAIDAYGAL